jgi:hypothetical protein
VYFLIFLNSSSRSNSVMFSGFRMIKGQRGQNVPMIDFGEASLGVVGAESGGRGEPNMASCGTHSALHSVPRQQRQHLRVTHTQASPLTHPGRTPAPPRRHQKHTRPSPGSRELRAATLTRQNGTGNSLGSSPDLSSPHALLGLLIRKLKHHFSLRIIR